MALDCPKAARTAAILMVHDAERPDDRLTAPTVAGQAYSRFNEQYFTSMACEGRIFDICSVASNSMDRSAAIRLWRHA